VEWVVAGWVVAGWVVAGWVVLRQGQVESNIYCLQSLVYYFTCISLASFRSSFSPGKDSL